MTSELFQSKLLDIQRNMLNFAYTLTSNRDDAYDLLQDTTLKVLDNEDKYIDNVNFKGWVFTIMRNLFINKYRRQARSAVIVNHSDDLYVLNFAQSSGIDTPEETYSAHEIIDMLSTFNDELRVPFSMYLSGYKYSEIAESMNLPLGTVKSRIFLARRKLQKRLSDYQ